VHISFEDEAYNKLIKIIIFKKRSMVNFEVVLATVYGHPVKLL